MKLDLRGSARGIALVVIYAALVTWAPDVGRTLLHLIR